MINHAAGGGQHSYEDRGVDCYETPPEAVHALLKVEKLPHKIWEPCCGSGNIAGTLIGAGHAVMASDLYDYNYGSPGVDFLATEIRPSADAIVTNPPYRLGQVFVERALELKVPLVIMLLRLAFLESERRARILERSGLARIHVFRNRLPMMHRRGWDGPKASSAIPFAWFVWERGYHGPTTIDRISWEPLRTAVDLPKGQALPVQLEFLSALEA
jgi:hypothetical protein